MAIMYITEYASAIGAGALQVPQEPPLRVQTVDFTTTTASEALQPGTKFVGIQLSADGHIHFDPTPVATIETSHVHKADSVSFHGADSRLKVAAVTV